MTGAVAILLAFLLFLVFFIFIYRYLTISKWAKNEKIALDSLLITNSDVSFLSSLYECCSTKITKHKLNACHENAIRNSTSSLTTLSIISTISPFIGLFGTVVGILSAFATFTDGVSLSTIAPAISEALIATALGILVAIPSYAFHLILKRKAYEISSYIKIQIDILLDRNNV